MTHIRIALVLLLLAIGVASAAETSRRAVKIGGTSAGYPAACQLIGAKAVGKRIERYAPAAPCMPLIPCGQVGPLMYRYEAQAGSSSGLPRCPAEIVNGVWSY